MGKFICRSQRDDADGNLIVVYPVYHLVNRAVSANGNDRLEVLFYPQSSKFCDIARTGTFHKFAGYTKIFKPFVEPGLNLIDFPAACSRIYDIVIHDYKFQINNIQFPMRKVQTFLLEIVNWILDIYFSPLVQPTLLLSL